MARGYQQGMMRPTTQNALKPLGLDGTQFNRAAPQSVKWSFTGAVGTATDQAPFYNVLGDVVESGATLGTPAPSDSAWSAANATAYLRDNPAPLENIHLLAATVSDLFDRSVIKLIRRTPDGNEQTAKLDLGKFVSDQRYQTNVLSVPIEGEPLDGWTYVRILSPQKTVTANGYSAIFNFAESIDRRADLPAARGSVVGALNK